jgi:hypothetical protein
MLTAAWIGDLEKFREARRGRSINCASTVHLNESSVTILP